MSVVKKPQTKKNKKKPPKTAEKKKSGKQIAKRGKLKYLKYFNSDIISEFILSKSFDYKLKQKVIWE